MAELTPLPSAQRPADAGYQPLSGYAVAATLVAGAFVLILLIVAVFAAIQKRALFSMELLILPVVGVALCVIARSHIRNSEGTRVGLQLLNGSWWACVLGGVGFGAYYFSSELVIKRESAAYTERFFNELKEGRYTDAFLYMIPQEERGRGNTADYAAFELTYNHSGFGNYKNNDLVRLVRRNGKEVEFEHVGSKDIKQESSGFKATHIYRVTCPEGVFEAQVTLQAPETRQQGKTLWHIPVFPSPHITLRPLQRSQYGALVADVEREGQAIATAWYLHLSLNRPVLGHLLTLPRAQRDAIERQLQSMSFMVGGAPMSMPVARWMLPGDRRTRVPAEVEEGPNLAFEDLNLGGFFRVDEAGNPVKFENLRQIKEQWGAPRFMGATMTRPGVSDHVVPDVTNLRSHDRTVLVTSPCELFLTNMHYARCVIGAECHDPDLVAAMAEARKRGAAAIDDGSVSITRFPKRDWRVAWLQTDGEPHTVVSGAMN